MKSKMFYWLLVGCLITVGAGAAVGVVLSGLIEGEISVTVSQAIQVERPTVTKTDGTAWPHPYFTSVSDDKTKFTAAVEVYCGEEFMVNLPIRNQGDSELVAEFTLSHNPKDEDGKITIDVDGSGVIDDVVRISSDTWKFTVDSNAADGTPPTFDGVKITVALGNKVEPGFYHLEGQLQVVEY
jgi:hypothetical protein